MPSQTNTLIEELNNFSPISHLKGFCDNEIESLFRLCKYSLANGWKKPKGCNFPTQINKESFKDYYFTSIYRYTLGFYVQQNIELIEKIALGEFQPSSRALSAMLKKAHLYEQEDAIKFLIQLHPDEVRLNKYFVPYFASSYESFVALIKEFIVIDHKVKHLKSGGQFVLKEQRFGKILLDTFDSNNFDKVEAGTFSNNDYLAKCNGLIEYLKSKIGDFFFDYHYVFKRSQRMEEWSRLEAAFYGQLVKSSLEFAASLQQERDKKINRLIEELLKNMRLLDNKDIFCDKNIDFLDETKPFDREYRFWPMLKKKHNSTANNFVNKLLEERKIPIKDDRAAIIKMISGYYPDYDWLSPNIPNIEFWPAPPSHKIKN